MFIHIWKLILRHESRITSHSFEQSDIFNPCLTYNVENLLNDAVTLPSEYYDDIRDRNKYLGVNVNTEINMSDMLSSGDSWNPMQLFTMQQSHFARHVCFIICLVSALAISQYEGDFRPVWFQVARIIVSFSPGSLQCQYIDHFVTTEDSNYFFWDLPGSLWKF